MKNILVAAAMFLLFSTICSCGGSDSDSVDCSSDTESTQTATSKSVGASVISVVPSGETSYIVQGTGMDGVAGIQLDITYDSDSLSTPTVTQGSLVTGAMLAAGTSLSGKIKIAIISTHPFSGSGPIAKISFATRTGSGGISLVSIIMIDNSGSPFASQDSNSPPVTLPPTPGDPFSQPSGVPFSQPPTSTTQPTHTISATSSTSCK